MKIFKLLFLFVLLGTMVQAQGNSGNQGPLPVVSSMKVNLSSPTTALVEIKISGVNASDMMPNAVINVSGEAIPGGSLTTSATAISGIPLINKGTVITNGNEQVIMTATIPVDGLVIGGKPQFVLVNFSGNLGSNHQGTTSVKKVGLCCIN